MLKKKKILVVLTMLAVLGGTFTHAWPAGAASGSDKYDLSKISERWQTISDEELNDYIGNSNDTDLYSFIMELSDEEKDELKLRDTMLGNDIMIDKGQGYFDSMPYFDWIIENGEKGDTSVFAARDIPSSFAEKSGYCFYRFVDYDSGYEVVYKVTFTLDSTANAELTTNNYTVASVIYKTSGSNSNKTGLDNVTFAKQKKYMQKAKTTIEVLGDGTSDTNDSGGKIYRTAITPIFVLTVKVPKPAYTYGTWSTSGFTYNGTVQTLSSGSRFNFNSYNWQNTGTTTFDNNVYHNEVVDTLTSAVNILSCGFTVENPKPVSQEKSNPEHDMMNVVYKHPSLKVNYYVNGGTVKATQTNGSAASPYTASVYYNKVYDSVNGLKNASTLGFSKTGHAAMSGKEWKTSDGSKTWSHSDPGYTAADLMDFTDGTYFTSKTRSIYVNWDPVIYKVTFDNQGAEDAGTENVWYKYNSYEEVTSSDGKQQTNYFYEDSLLKTAVEKGSYIENPVRSGYIFKGYWTEKNGQGEMYVNSSGEICNQLWKTIGDHTLYAYWEKEAAVQGTLKIRRILVKDDYYSSHGESIFLYKIISKDDPERVYYRTISFDNEIVKETVSEEISCEVECRLPCGNYTVEAVKSFRYDNILESISQGSVDSISKGSFQLNDECDFITAEYGGRKSSWSRFSHNDLVINQLE